MDRARRRVWRVSGSTLVLLGLLTAVCLLGLPTLAWFSWQARPSLWVPGLLGLLALLGLLYAWRFGWHPRVVATETRLVVKNPFRTTRFGWQDVSLVLPGGNGLLVAGPDHRAEAWCVQKSDRDHRSGRPSRADRIGDEIWALWLLHHPPVEVRGQYVITRARPGIEAGLAELERRASSEALSHIFPGERFPFPIETVTERWHDVLRDPTKQTFVALSEEPAPDPDPGDEAGSDFASDTGPGARAGSATAPARRPIGYVAHSSTAVLHLGVDPSLQRQGCGTMLLRRAEAEIFTDPVVTEASLWVLEHNRRALGFYHDHGWRDTDNRRRSPYPPKPPELRMIKANPRAARRTRAGRS